MVNFYSSLNSAFRPTSDFNYLPPSDFRIPTSIIFFPHSEFRIASNFRRHPHLLIIPNFSTSNLLSFPPQSSNLKPRSANLNPRSACLHRQQHPKSTAPSLFALHLDDTVVSFHNHLALEKTNAGALRFSGLEGSEKAFVQ